MYVKSQTDTTLPETNKSRRIDAAIANLDRIADVHRRRWLTGKVIWAGERFDRGRARA